MKGARDPLGAQAIGTRPGRYVAGRMTTSTTSTRGSVTLLVMVTFPVIRRNDEQTCDNHQPTNLILEIHDEVQSAIDTGRSFVSRPDPPRGDPRAAHGGA